jgi:hypothetical protein
MDNEPHIRAQATVGWPLPAVVVHSECPWFVLVCDGTSIGRLATGLIG